MMQQGQKSVLMLGGFISVHPWVSFVYCMGVLIGGMLFKNPIYSGSLLSIVILNNFLLDKGKVLKEHLKFSLILAGLIVLINPLTSARGRTILFYLGSRNITLESIIYGVLFASSLLIILFLFNIYNILISPQRFLYLFSNVVPKVAFIIAITMRFIPLMRYRMEEIIGFQKTLKSYRSQLTWKQKMKEGIENLNVLISWTLEESLENAASMRSRGYGAFKRSSAYYYKLEQRDCLLIGIMLMTSMIGGIGYFNGYGLYDVYKETIGEGLRHIQVIHYLSVVLFAGLPTIIQLREWLRWHYIRCKI